MSTEQDDKVSDLLADMEEHIREKRAAHYLKRLRWGRSSLFLIAIFNLISVLKMVSYKPDPVQMIFPVVMTLIYFFAFFSSRYKAYISLSSVSVIYLAHSLYIYFLAFSSGDYNLLFNMDTNIFSIIIIITIAMRFIFLFYLVNGAVYARRFEEQEKGIE